MCGAAPAMANLACMVEDAATLEAAGEMLSGTLTIARAFLERAGQAGADEHSLAKLSNMVDFATKREELMRTHQEANSRFWENFDLCWGSLRWHLCGHAKMAHFLDGKLLDEMDRLRHSLPVIVRLRMEVKACALCMKG